jgi:hypothetical protein
LPSKIIEFEMVWKIEEIETIAQGFVDPQLGATAGKSWTRSVAQTKGGCPSAASG